MSALPPAWHLKPNKNKKLYLQIYNIGGRKGRGQAEAPLDLPSESEYRNYSWLKSAKKSIYSNIMFIEQLNN